MDVQPPATMFAAAIAELNAAGHRIEVVTGDIAAPDTAGRLVQTVEHAGFRLAGVLHSAMVLADEIVLNMSDSAARRVFTPKVTGSWRLHQATAALDVDWWLTFSSAASLLGAPGQGAYAAANSWVDGLVAYRRSLGLPAVGINWGPWAEVGRAQFFADLGVSMITAEQGLAAMQSVLAADRARTGVFSLDARQWFQSFPATAGSSLFAKLHDSTTVERRGGGAIRAQLDALGPAERPGRLASAIADEIRAVLRSSDAIDHDQPLATLGLDSLMGLELRNRLEASLGITLPVALVWAYPTITDLAGALCERMDYAPPADCAADFRRGSRTVRRGDGLALRSGRGQRARSRDESASHDKPRRPRGPTVAERASSPRARACSCRDDLPRPTLPSRWRWSASVAVSRGM